MNYFVNSRLIFFVYSIGHEIIKTSEGLAKMLDRNSKYNVLEQHYYMEDNNGKKRKLSKIEDADEKKEIDAYMKRHRNHPPENTTRETGYSSLVVHADIKINPSMLKKKKVSQSKFKKTADTFYIISRLEDAPKLPVSCLASTEHVVCMQNEVEDFKSEYKPTTKKQVMFQILVQCKEKKFDVDAKKNHLTETICKNDGVSCQENVSITFNEARKLFTVEISTQLADIQQVVRNLNHSKSYTIINSGFDEVALNQGICLLNRDTSNPIHALTNIGDSVNGKVLLERDAGLTSGLSAGSYQDNNWIFNFFQNMDDLKKRAGYKDNAYAIRILKA